MSLRTKIVVWFLLLSVLPLAVIVLYSYVASTRALRRAVTGETWELAAGLQEQLEATRIEISERVKSLDGLPWGKLLVGSDEIEAMNSKYREVLRGLAPFVESLEFVPAPVAPRAEPEPIEPPSQLIFNGDGETFYIEIDKLLGVGVEDLEVAWATDEVLADGEKVAAVRFGMLAATRALDAIRGLPSLGVGGGESLEAEALRLEQARQHLAKMRALAIRKKSKLPDRELELLKSREEQSRRVLGEAYVCPVEVEGEAIGSVHATVWASRVVADVLGRADRSSGEIPFAFDTDDRVYLAQGDDEQPLQAMGLIAEGRMTGDKRPVDWVVAYLADEASELTFGIARPIRDSVRELRTTAGRNFGLGFGLVGLALIGVVPLSRRLTRDLEELTAGSERLAAGNWDVRVPVRSRDEVGTLARSFNRLARELADNQQRLVDTQLQQRLLEAENERKGCELEEARQFQLSLLPKELPEHPQLELAVFMRTATEVGGDYYDFQQADDGTLTVAIGDATGHGAKAGTMVTVIKSLFTAWSATDALAEFLSEAATAIRSMHLGRMAMALCLVRIEGHRLKISSAGMPPVLICRRGGVVEEVCLSGLPLGGMARSYYAEHRVDLETGDTILMMSDGFPELPNEDGEPIGYDRVRRLFEGACTQEPQEIIDELAQYASAWHPGQAPADDVTFVVLRVRG